MLIKCKNYTLYCEIILKSEQFCDFNSFFILKKSECHIMDAHRYKNSRRHKYNFTIYIYDYVINIKSIEYFKHVVFKREAIVFFAK